MNARSSWRSALVSSPPKPIFSLGISRGPEACADAPFELAVGAPGEAVEEERGANAAPFINELMPGTPLPALAGSEGFGDAAMGLREWNGAMFSCFTR
jgi:hypothetical protein